MNEKKSGKTMSHKTEKKEWWHDGVQFSCQGSGKCCVSHGEFGFVYMTLADRKRMARSLKMPTSAFTKKYCQKSDGFYHLIDGDKQACVFLKNKSCTVYEGRPTQCRTWPFWPEVMGAKTWKAEVAKFCPGVGKGKVWSKQEIEKALQDQQKAESQS